MNEQTETTESTQEPAIAVPDGLTGAQAEQFIQGELVRKEIERKQAAGELLTADEEASLGVVAAKAAEAALTAEAPTETEAETETETEAEAPGARALREEQELETVPADPEQDSN